jgi:hypothetical protein
MTWKLNDIREDEFFFCIPFFVWTLQTLCRSERGVYWALILINTFYPSVHFSLPQCENLFVTLCTLVKSALGFLTWIKLAWRGIEKERVQSCSFVTPIACRTSLCLGSNLNYFLSGAHVFCATIKHFLKKHSLCNYETTNVNRHLPLLSSHLLGIAKWCAGLQMHLFSSLQIPFGPKGTAHWIVSTHGSLSSLATE